MYFIDWSLSEWKSYRKPTTFQLRNHLVRTASSSWRTTCAESSFTFVCHWKQNFLVTHLNDEQTDFTPAATTRAQNSAATTATVQYLTNGHLSHVWDTICSLSVRHTVSMLTAYAPALPLTHTHWNLLACQHWKTWKRSSARVHHALNVLLAAQHVWRTIKILFQNPSSEQWDALSHL